MRLLYFLLFILSIQVQAQTKEQLRDVIENTNVTYLNELKEKFNFEFLDRKVRIDEFLRNNPKVKKSFYEGDVFMEIYDVSPQGEIFYYQTSNLNSSITARTNHMYNGGSLGLNVQGQDMLVGVWDGGSVRSTHEEFEDFRVTNVDAASINDHATHVMGTILAKGVTSTLRGIAFEADGLSYDWNNDYAEMTNAAADGLLVSNHSYWIGSTLSTWILGAYDSRAKQLDELTFAAPFYLPVVAAGNDRNRYDIPIIADHLNSKFGYDLIRGMQNAKNFLTVGAVSDVLNYQDASDVNMSTFSSWGPTDDGRIKPEVVAKGVSVRSTTFTDDTSNGFKSGTSMASPAVAGVALLLQQHYFNVSSSFMRSASLKGLIIHTADEAGFEPGPDYEYGYGLVNAGKAAELINDKAISLAVIDELTLLNGTDYTRTIIANGVENLKFSISWTDRAYPTANSGTEDPDVNYLVNDLDIKVSKDGIDYFPWKLDKTDPFMPATNNSTNDVDNYERIDIQNPSGVYTITVSHKGTLVGGSQNFSLIVSGPNVVLNTDDFIKDGIALYPNPSKDWLTIDVASTTLEKIYFYDLQGRLVKQINSNGLNKEQINIQDLSSGVYYLNVVTSEGSISKKIVKE
jgi:serine protease AprX